MVDGGTEGLPLKCVAADYPRCETATIARTLPVDGAGLSFNLLYGAPLEFLVLSSSIITFVAT